MIPTVYKRSVDSYKNILTNSVSCSSSFCWVIQQTCTFWKCLGKCLIIFDEYYESLVDISAGFISIVECQRSHLDKRKVRGDVHFLSVVINLSERGTTETFCARLLSILNYNHPYIRSIILFFTRCNPRGLSCGVVSSAISACFPDGGHTFSGARLQSS